MNEFKLGWPYTGEPKYFILTVRVTLLREALWESRYPIWLI